MRIAVDIRSLMEGRQSGVETYTTEIVRTMARMAPSTIFQAYYNAARTVVLPDFPDNVHVTGFHYPNKLFNTSQWLFKAPRWDSLVPADVFFVPNPRITPLSLNMPLVTVAHDLSFEQFPEFLTVRRRLWHSIVRPRKLLEASTKIIAVSQHTKEDIVRMYGIDPNKIVVIHSGISVGMPRSKDIQRVRQVYDLPPHFILSFGRQEPRKNIVGLIAAFSAIAGDIPHDLVIAGEGGWKEHEVERAIAASPFSERIYRLGVIHEQDKMSLYGAADVFVYPSFYEGFGFPPLEALLAGTPVITSMNSALPEVVGKWAVMIDPHNTAHLAAVLRDVLHTPTRVDFDTRHEIEQTYRWQDTAQQTLSVLREAAQAN